MVYTLAFRFFPICSNWTHFHNELAFLKDIFLKNGYPISFIGECFKTFLDQLYLKKPELNFRKFSKEHQVVVKSRQFSKIKKISRTFSVLKIVYFMALCLSFNDFTILAHGSNMFFLEIIESLLIKPDKLILNKKTSVPLQCFYLASCNIIG